MMLLLSVLRCPESAVPEQRRVPGGDYTIGRGADCDWVLPDPEGVLSRRHCVLEFRSGGWQVRDLSTNGTFVNHEAEPVGRDRVKPLEDGDRLRLGGYEIELRIEQDAAAGMGPAAWGGGVAGGAVAGPGWAAQDAAADPGWDPLAPPPHALAGGGGPAPALPDDFDPFAEDPTPMPDHRPSVEDVFVPPRVIPAAPGMGGAGAPGGAHGGAGLGGEWDLDLPPLGGAPAAPPGAGAPAGATPALDDWDLSPPPAGGAVPPAPDSAAAPPVPAPGPMPAAGTRGASAQPPVAPRGPVAPPPPPRPVAAAASADAVPPPVAGPSAAAAQDDFDPFAEEAPVTAPGGSGRPSAASVAPPPTPATAVATPVAAAVPVAPIAVPAGPGVAHGAAPPPGPAPAGAAAQAAAGLAGSGLAAFLAGAGLAPGALSGTVADPDAALRGLGTAFRAVIAGLRALLIARADVKREFRIEQTVLRAAGNNPLKFAATDDAAVLSLAAQGARGVGAVEETIADLTAHQIATLAATQAAARALLERLAPAGLEAEVKGGGSLFGASREKLLWEAYKKLHQQVVEQFEDDFDSAFGKAFARAYEQAARRDSGGGGAA